MDPINHEVLAEFSVPRPALKYLQEPLGAPSVNANATESTLNRVFSEIYNCTNNDGYYIGPRRLAPRGRGPFKKFMK